MSQLASTKPLSNLGDGFEAIYPGVSQKLSTIVTSAQSAALGARTSIVQLYATQDVHIKVGANPTAVADGTCMFIPKLVAKMIGVAPGNKIAAIRDSADGVLYITEGA